MGKSAFKPGNMLYPLPAVMVSCQYPGTSDPECSNPALSGRPNILTVAWAGTVCTNPPMLSISVRPERYSYHMIEAAGEFVVNLTTESLVRATDYCGVRSGRDVDKFKEMHLTPLASREVSVPGIAESPVNIECRVRQITPLGSHNLILADVVAVTIDDNSVFSYVNFAHSSIHIFVHFVNLYNTSIFHSLQAIFVYVYLSNPHIMNM